MKRSCESNLSEDANDKKQRFTVHLSNITNVSLENIQLAETIDLTPECAAEIVHPQIDHDQITQDEDRYFQFKSVILERFCLFNYFVCK